MAILNEELQEKIDELIDSAFIKFEEGKFEESFSLQKRAWDIFPDPKEQWNEAYNIAKYIYTDYLNVGVLLFISAMLCLIISLFLFLREIFYTTSFIKSKKSYIP